MNEENTFGKFVSMGVVLGIDPAAGEDITEYSFHRILPDGTVMPNWVWGRISHFEGITSEDRRRIAQHCIKVGEETQYSAFHELDRVYGVLTRHGRDKVMELLDAPDIEKFYHDLIWFQIQQTYEEVAKTMDAMMASGSLKKEIPPKPDSRMRRGKGGKRSWRLQ